MHKLITSTQLKAARHALNLGVRDLSQVIKISKTVINDAENNKTRDFFFKYSPALIDYFAKYNVIFPNTHCISYKIHNTTKPEKAILSRFQLKVSRSILCLSQEKLSSYFGIDRKVISKAERLKNNESISFSPNLTSEIIKFFLDKGIDLCIHMSVYYKN